MTMFGPWYDPRDDSPTSPWPGFDPDRIVARILALLVPIVLVVLAVTTYAAMDSITR